MLGSKPMAQWIEEYSRSHRPPVNRACHTIGIPTIALSVPLFVVTLFVPRLWPVPTALFVGGWALQFVGHWFEGRPPEFFRDWRFLFVGARWWLAKLRGRV